MSTIQIHNKLDKIKDEIISMFFFDSSLEIKHDDYPKHILLEISRESFPVFDILRVQKISKVIKRERMYMGINLATHKAVLKIYIQK